MKIFLIRHGQTTSDVEDRYGGDYEDHLTDLGKTQAAGLADKLKDKNIEVIFASNRVRAQETAQILNEKLGVEIMTDDGLRERNLYAVLSGMKKSEAKEKYPEFVERIKNTEDTIPGAETRDDFVKRVVDSYNNISQKTQYKTVAVVSHGGPIRRILWEIFNIKREQSDVKIEDCAYMEIESDTSGNKILKMDGIEILDSK